MTDNSLPYVQWFRGASPYINAHRDRTMVLMLGETRSPTKTSITSFMMWLSWLPWTFAWCWFSGLDPRSIAPLPRLAWKPGITKICESPIPPPSP